MSEVFAAVVAHADDADMLLRCVRHHLAIGVDAVFVSLNTGDPDSALAARELARDARVRVAPVESFARDPFQYFTAAKDVVLDWIAPDWMMFVDSDEFWVPRTGRIADTGHLEDTDEFAVPVLQAVPIREHDGQIGVADGAAHETLVFGPRVVLNADDLARNPELSFVMIEYDKVLVRPQIVAEVGRGAHDVRPTIDAPRRRGCADLAIVHYPFTSRERFHRKMERVRARLHAYGDRFQPGQAWQWRRWAALDAAGIDAEFERQAFRADDVPGLVARGVLTTPAHVVGTAAR